ncbi:hypothetical protein QFZ34_001899 [Phyllobacterium ifriqiyense]|uniref:Uncharacterized protein n=1 Tax=Phyllobacterium ifriqiyense TaxID=314238 RepID=A0ABU0S7H6_9HYPH|nr:hypothetical protein [Phyllobacterium ifriqiyense]
MRLRLGTMQNLASKLLGFDVSDERAKPVQTKSFNCDSPSLLGEGHQCPEEVMSCDCEKASRAFPIKTESP